MNTCNRPHCPQPMEPQLVKAKQRKKKKKENYKVPILYIPTKAKIEYLPTDRYVCKKFIKPRQSKQGWNRRQTLCSEPPIIGLMYAKSVCKCICALVIPSQNSRCAKAHTLQILPWSLAFSKLFIFEDG